MEGASHPEAAASERYYDIFEKHYAEHPVIIAETRKRGVGAGDLLILAAAGIICAVSFTASGREFLGGTAFSLRQLFGH